MPYVIATRIATNPDAKVMLPHQSIRAGRRTPRSSSLRHDQTVPNSPTGTETTNTRRQSTGPSSPHDPQADERPGDARHRVDAERGAALVVRKGVGQDRG